MPLTPSDFHNLAKLIASGLPGAWLSTPSFCNEECDGLDVSMAKLSRKSDGLVLCFNGSTAHDVPAGRIAIAFVRPIYTTGEQIELWEGSTRVGNPRITVAADRPAHAIADAITKRLLPEAMRVQQLAQAKANAWDQHEHSMLLFLQNVTVLLGKGDIPRDRYGKPQYECHFPGCNIKLTATTSAQVTLDVSRKRLPALLQFLHSDAYTQGE